MNAVAEMALSLREYGPATFLYANGDMLFIHADRRLQRLTGEVTAPALYQLECPAGDKPALVHDDDFSDAQMTQRLILFATVPLTDEAWKPMPRGAVTAVRRGEIAATMQL